MAYQTINKIIQKNDGDIIASEAHGLATGMLCIENKTEAANWLLQLFPEQIVLLDDDKTVLVGLFEQTRKLLNDEDYDFRFDLFLPADDVSLQQQLIALCRWCEGFLFGVGYSRSSSEWPGETGEVMKDIVEFTKMETDVDGLLTEEDVDEQEAALIEIQEYLRAAVIMVRDQFVAQENGQRH